MQLPMQTIQAIAVAPGIAIGKVMRSNRKSPRLQVAEGHIAPQNAEAEKKRFYDAVSATRQELEKLKEEMQGKLHSDEAKIFDAHLMILDDAMILSGVETGIMQSSFSAEYALSLAIEKICTAFCAIGDEYLNARADDIRDIAERLMAKLVPTEESKTDYNEPRILIATSLTPSETAGLDRDRVLGFAVETGSTTSHTAILARSMCLPAVVGVPKELLDDLDVADKLIVDGFTGKVIVNPDSRTEEAYTVRQQEARHFFSELQHENHLPPETTDGFLIQLAANLDISDNYPGIRKEGAHGVGLFRTEFLFMDPEKLPTEEEQFEIYRKLLVAAENAPVTVRTMDIGGDKLNSGIVRSGEQNPFLGLRGIRLSLREQQKIFRIQLRALLRAGVYGNLRIMLPMISSITEIQATRKIIDELKGELAAESLPFAPDLPLGVMIETPAAALIADQLAPLVAFFSIGTNDLIQYTMAVDRSNERVAYLYKPTHPAILRLIAHTVQAAHKANIFAAVCGHMAESIAVLPLLIGLGVDELSMPLSAIPPQRRTIRHLSRRECEELCEKALKCSTATEVLNLTRAMLKERAPEMSEIEQ